MNCIWGLGGRSREGFGADRIPWPQPCTINNNHILKEHQQVVTQTAAFVQQQLENAEAGHDWWHIQRVWNNTLLLLENEKGADRLICELGALLHDIADPKFHDGDESKGPDLAEKFLRQQGVEQEIVTHVRGIVATISFSQSLPNSADRDDRFRSRELEIVQDADRLDALGAIGIARAFHYGGFRNRLLFHPDIPPVDELDKETYRKSNGPTINHFYEKLLLLKDQMNTQTARQMAAERHAFMESFLQQFFKEWNGK